MRFKDSFDIEFPKNQVTLIAGENGAGKTSILDGICICLYGKTFRTSGRTTSGYLRINDLVNHESPKATIRVEFENHGHNYAATREITKHDSKGELLEDGESKARDQRVYDYVRNRAIGLDWEGFRKSTIVLQGEMSSLTQLEPSKRKEAFVTLFGLDRYFDYDKLALEKAKAKQSDIDKTEEANKILSADVRKIPGVKHDIKRIKRLVNSLERRKLQLDKTVEQRKQEKDALEGDYNHYAVQKEKLNGVTSLLKEARKTVRRNSQELGRLLGLQKKFPKLERSYQEFSSLEIKISSLGPIKSEYDGYDSEVTGHRTSLEEAMRKLSENRRDMKQTTQEISNLKRQIPSPRRLGSVENSLDKSQSRKSRLEKNEAGFNAEIKRIKKSIQTLEGDMRRVKGKAKCPVCLQKITEPEQVIGHYLLEIRSLESEKRERGKRLKSVRGDLQAVSNKLGKLKLALAELKERAAKKGELNRELRRLSSLSDKKEPLRTEIGELKLGIKHLLQLQEKLCFNPGEYGNLERRMRILRRNKIAEKFSNAKTELDRLTSVEENLRESKNRLSSNLADRDNLTGEIEKLGNIELRYKAAKTRFERAQEASNRNNTVLVAKSQDKKQFEGQLKELKEKERILKNNEKTIRVSREEITAFEELRDIFKNIPENIMRRLRPFIEKEGTDIINDLSSGELTALNIEEETLNVAATMNGVVRPIHYFSGGQKTRINMALRVAISRILSKLPQTEEHTFAVMRTLFIDEGDFGDLDEPGVREAIAVVRNLTREFDCVVLISHVDAIREIFHGYTIEVIKTGMDASAVKTFGGRAGELEAPEMSP